MPNSQHLVCTKSADAVAPSCNSFKLADIPPEGRHRLEGPEAPRRTVEAGNHAELRPCPAPPQIEKNRTWVNNEIDEAKLCTTLFRDVCGDSILLLSTVVSLPCEVSTESLIPDLELTRVSVD